MSLKRRDGTAGGPSPRVLITGAASGIGEATADNLRRHGARVVGLDLESDRDDVIGCDVAVQGEVDDAVEAATNRLGGLDALVNCAGISPIQSAATRPGTDAVRVLDVNLLGPWRVTSAALPTLRLSRGRVVNVASGLAYLTMPFAVAYCMSKRGLTAYSDALRLEEDGAVAVTTVYPGYVKTPIHAQAARDGISLEGIVPAEPLEQVVAALTRAVLGPPIRDLATSRRGGLSYFLLRHLPPRFTDRLLRRHLRRAAVAGRFDGSDLATGLRANLLGSPKGAGRSQ
jgi:NAD(P)-dependent dehydrogenase (short-subunit alcohol dehydrogenase family)